MKKYIVRVNILKSDKKGTVNSENFEYTYQEPNLFEARNKAISKVKELEELFNYGMPEGSEFSSPLEAQFKGFKDFNAYSIELTFMFDEDWEYQIYGEEELTIESLEIEANHYVGQEDMEYVEVEDLNGQMVVVLESDLEFFLN
ncbi:hypothetical protein [Lutibacter flavus]|uniref:Uncharacterized protein n=1 Tax=Lutibacter flavus TaxID=691689 RepID=A0A238VI88_9FLAO|nr:hypothetical protein [Lutibacter flavus]SNR33837.1 hypothetical protein SAMN04488111_0514 [Lutibacter flavus]